MVRYQPIERKYNEVALMVKEYILSAADITPQISHFLLSPQ
jgi:hypothetical protein